MTNEELSNIIKPKECRACYLMTELFKHAEQTNRNYYLLTELFVLLHDGKDYCKVIDISSDS